MTADGKIYIRSYLITPIENDISEDGKSRGYHIKFVFFDGKKEDFRKVKVYLSEAERNSVDKKLYKMIRQNFDFYEIPFERILEFIKPYTERK